MITITFKDKKCTSVPFDKTIFNGMDNTIVRVISDNTDYTATCVAVCSYISETIAQSVYPCGSLDYDETHDSIEITLQVRFY